MGTGPGHRWGEASLESPDLLSPGTSEVGSGGRQGPRVQAGATPQGTGPAPLPELGGSRGGRDGSVGVREAEPETPLRGPSESLVEALRAADG